MRLLAVAVGDDQDAFADLSNLAEQGAGLGIAAALASGLIGVHGETAHAAGYGASAAGEEIRLRLPLTVEHAAIKAAPGHRQQENNTQGDLQRTIHCLLAPLKIGAR